eukprot:2554320-Rhodomonas_salina.3
MSMSFMIWMSMLTSADSLRTERKNVNSVPHSKIIAIPPVARIATFEASRQNSTKLVIAIRLLSHGITFHGLK